MERLHVMNGSSLEPWLSNIIDLTLSDGTHRVGLLQKIDGEWAQLTTGRGMPPILDGGRVRISDAVSIIRGARN